MMGQYQSNRGFTLIEMVVSMAILGIVASMGSLILREGFQTAYFGKDTVNIDWQSRLILNRLSNELRHVRTPTAADLTMSPASEITFTDVNGLENRFYLSGSQLLRQEDGQTPQVIAQDVSSLSFSYRDEDGAVTVNVSDVRYITVELAFTKGDIIRSFETTLFPRNFQ